jgi:hypothetical protein
MVPLSVLLLEDNKTRKRILYALLALGTAIALYYTYRMVFYDINAEISRRHIVYLSSAPHNSAIAAIILYLVATIVPLFVSSIKRIHIVGTIMGLSFIVSAIFYKEFLISVWCFFAAVISFVVFYIIKDAHQKFHFSKQAGNK